MRAHFQGGNMKIMEDNKFPSGATNLTRDNHGGSHPQDKEVSFLGEATDVAWESYWIDLGGEG